jgi:DNA polymerase-3 subunit epsilon/exodeoxyribonuclease X
VLIFLDLETTGLEHSDKIISIALVVVDGDKTIKMYDEVNEGKKISPKASSINHITNEMIKNKPKLIDSQTYKFLQKHNLEATTLIAHNIKFDIEKLASSGLHFIGKMIDTLRVTKHLIPECDGFSLQHLRYELKLYKQEEEKLCAHHALGDALLVRLLFNYLLDIASVEKMCELSFKNVLIDKFKFGKYANRYIEEIILSDRGYIEWMLSNIMDLDEDLRYSISHYLQKNL